MTFTGWTVWGPQALCSSNCPLSADSIGQSFIENCLDCPMQGLLLRNLGMHHLDIKVSTSSSSVFAGQAEAISTKTDGAPVTTTQQVHPWAVCGGNAPTLPVRLLLSLKYSSPVAWDPSSCSLGPGCLFPAHLSRGLDTLDYSHAHDAPGHKEAECHLPVEAPTL